MMSIVQFRNGKYGIRRTHWFRYQFLGRLRDNWVQRNSKTRLAFTEYDSLAEAVKRRNKEVKNTSETLGDDGSIVPVPDTMGYQPDSSKRLKDLYVPNN